MLGTAKEMEETGAATGATCLMSLPEMQSCTDSIKGQCTGDTGCRALGNFGFRLRWLQAKG